MMSALFNGAEAHVCRVGRLRPETSIFFCCDIQELFRPLILKMPHVIDTARRMGDAAKILGIPLVVTEQYPKAMGHTVPEINTSSAVTIQKTLFSMCVPEVLQLLNQQENLMRRSVVLYGIEAHVCIQNA
eukprot:GHVQ01001383.1.p1 GENE.GHVQ01001383.1~~GHVQ01001383.1.p1  ORF type:complete len:130 (+),score=13.05 GHVQ01001383.1:175-564(+)